MRAAGVWTNRLLCPRALEAGLGCGRAGQGRARQIRGRGRAGAGSDVAIVVGTISSVRAAGHELSKKGSGLPAALHYAWVPTLSPLAPVSDNLSASGNLNQLCGEVLRFHEVPAWGRECESERQ